MKVLFLACVVGGAAAPLLAATPSITKIQPWAVVPGRATEIHLEGGELDGATQLWTSFTGEVSALNTATPIAFALKVSKEMPPGLGAVRLVTTNGLSALHLLLIDPLPGAQGGSTNHSPATAQRVPARGAVDGVCEELRSDFYRIAAKKGEELSIEVVAQRLGSPLDPWLRVLDAHGREVALNDDAPGLDADARIDFRCPKSGDYLIELRDTRHAGGARHRYRLRVGTALPTPLPFFSSREVAERTKPLNASASAPETEPNDAFTRAQFIRLPVELTARFDQPGDRDVYEFQARKGERVIVAGKTRSLGSPCDLFLQLQATNGALLAEANATGADEGILTNRFNADATYRLVVEELNQQGGRNFAYRIAIGELKPGFVLSTETERVSAPAGDSIEIEVKAGRRDYDGPIQLAVRGLPGAFAVTNALIAAKTNATKLQITTPSDLPLGECFLFSILGSAEINGAQVSERVSTAPALRSAFPELRHPPAELDGLLTLSVSESKSTNPKPPQKKRRTAAEPPGQ
jgi:hypothetical protein